MSANPMGSCPLGGDWWICLNQSPTFFGCCASDPCNGIGCPEEDLLPAGMGTAGGPDASSNDGSYWPNAGCPNGGVWYTCSRQTPSFQGCCDDSNEPGSIVKFDPCHENGCPSSRLYAAAFNSVPATFTSVIASKSSPVLTSSLPISLSSTLSSSTLSSSALSSISASPSISLSSTSSPTIRNSAADTSSIRTPSSKESSTASATVGSTGHSSNSKLPIAAIIGSALSGVVVILLVLLIIFCVQRHKKRATLAGAVEPYYQPPPQDMSMVKVTSSPFVYEGSPSDAEAPQKDYRPISEIPSSPPLSPAPPYQSAPQSPDFSNYHEIDSSILHEVESPPLQQRSFMSRPGTVELPDTYTCTAQTPTFFGCCTSNPCNNKGCPASDLRAAGLGHGEAGDEGPMNLGSYWPNVYCSSGSWWICSSQNPSFQGCCDIDPCSSNATNCPQPHLYPAAFKSVTTALSFPGSQITTFQTSILPTATFPLPTISMTTPPGASTTDQFLSSAYPKSSRTTPWNSTGYSTQSSSNYSNSGAEPTTSSILYFTTSSIPISTGIAPSSTLLTNCSDANNKSTFMAVVPSIVTVTSISTFTAVRISVYTVPYSSSDTTYPSDSLPLFTTTSTPVTKSPDSSSITSPLYAASSISLSPTTSTALPSGTTTDTKLIAWGASGGVAFILICALVSWFLRRRRKKANKNNSKPMTTSLSTRLPWKKTSKEIPRISLSSYPFKGMAPSTSNTSEEGVNETWSATLRDYRNLGLIDVSKLGLNNNSEPSNQKPTHLSGYESHYSRPFQSQALHNNEISTSLGGGLDRNSFAQRMVQRGWDAVDLQNGYVGRDDGNEWHGGHDRKR
ncbi:hypothetical protein BCON_0005g00090 [Botryotinia convoluta]|uniref:Uncharacterized protein n=1 Tax=Botryotinia convoluta TaxID=54673 RepID=A0A4Z1J6T5_9HELO|nr:hypothetical protein BCON_0005g00090 [Botryotinia convoluta]